MGKIRSIKVVHIVGARPQFIKMAPVVSALETLKRSCRMSLSNIIIHTGQHYDRMMSGVFFKELSIPKPHYNLEVGSSSHGEQTGKMIQGLEKVLLKEKPDFVFLYGDTNSTLAGAIAASKIRCADSPKRRTRIVHIEAGLRSFDKSIPEEVNRLITDHVSDLLFCPSKTAVSNLKNEGIIKGVYFTGDVMFDSLLRNGALVKKSRKMLLKFKVKPKGYFLLTVHRQDNTDNLANLKSILSVADNLPFPVIFPVHPRTRKSISRLKNNFDNIVFTEPFSYLEMLTFEKYARIILTDSGGVQKEAYLLHVPCITLRQNSEWVETVKSKWNILTGIKRRKIIYAVSKFGKIPPKRNVNYYGTGRSASKMAKILFKNISKQWRA